MIVACDENGAIGKDGDLPWRQSTDLKRFKNLTTGKTIIMGRKKHGIPCQVLSQTAETL